MTNKIGLIFLTVVFLVGALIVSAETAFCKSRTTVASHRKASIHDKGHFSRGLVLRSAAVLVEDQRTGELLVQKQASAIVPIASITKLMTAMVVLDANIDLEESIAVQTSDVDVLRHSHSRLPVGTQYSRREALLLALMASENRSAHALGRTFPGGHSACVAAMNAKARALGLAETHFEDTTGLNSGNVSSARDLVRLVDTAYQYRLIREYTTSKHVTIQSGRRLVEFRNTNRLIQNPRWDIGLSKTGFIGEAGRCLVMQAHVAHRPVLIVLLDSQGRLTRVGDANRIKKWLEGPGSGPGTRKG